MELGGDNHYDDLTGRQFANRIAEHGGGYHTEYTR